MGRMPKRVTEVFEEALKSLQNSEERHIYRNYTGPMRSKMLSQLDERIKEMRGRFYGGK